MRPHSTLIRWLPVTEVCYGLILSWLFLETALHQTWLDPIQCHSSHSTCYSFTSRIIFISILHMDPYQHAFATSSLSSSSYTNNHDVYFHASNSAQNLTYSYITRSHPTSHPPTGDVTSDWNGLFRLLLYALVATGGTMGSIFIISAITVVSTFQVRGNSYLASLSMGHLIVTVFVLPSTCIAIMAGVPDNPVLCHWQWLATMTTLMVHVLSFMFISMENTKGLETSSYGYEMCCSKFRITVTTILIWVASLGVTAAQHIKGWGPDICQESGPPAPIWPAYHGAVGAGLIVVPTLITILYFARAVFKIKRYRVLMNENPLNPIYFLTDESTLKSNVAVYALSLFMWTPLSVVAAISTFHSLDPDLLDTCWWIAMGYSCCYSFLYAFTNREFGDSFLQLFYYCCCKSHVNWVRKGVGGK